MPELVKTFWNFVYNETAPESVTLRLDGNIIDSERAWIYEWFGIPAASPNAFRAELAKYKGKNITLWVDSNGGSVFAAMGIYDALMEHKNTGAKVTAVIEKAMSAATIPVMAADIKDRLIAPGGMWMMHNPLTDLMGGYASDFRKIADVLDEVKAAILNIYQLGTGLSRSVLSGFMDRESYMSAGTAVQEGFVGGIKYVKSDSQTGVMNFAFDRLAIQMVVNDSAKDFIEMVKAGQIVSKNVAEQVQPAALEISAVVPVKPVANIKTEERSIKMDIKSVEDLRMHFPELVNQIETAAVTGERTRIKEIHDVAGRLDPKLATSAMFDKPVNARELVFRAFQAEAVAGQTYLVNAATDSAAAGVDAVGAAPPAPVNEQKPADLKTRFTNVVASINAKRTGVEI